MVPSGKAKPGVWVLVNVRPVGQLSVAVGAVHVTELVHPEVSVTLLLAGQFVIVGSVTSFTITSKEHVAVLPEASVAV